MGKNYIKKRKKMSKKMCVTITVIVVAFVSIAFIGKYFAVDFIFDNYIVKPALEVVKEGGIAEMMEQGEQNEQSGTNEQNANEPDAAQASETVPPPNEENSGNNDNNNNNGETKNTNTQQNNATSPNAVKELTTAEIAYKVLASPELMAKLEGMVSSSDKSAVISIAKSCFTLEEKKYYLAEIAKSGLTSQVKSEMMGIVRSRMTGEKKSTVLSLFSKYAEQLRPYVQ